MVSEQREISFEKVRSKNKHTRYKNNAQAVWLEHRVCVGGGHRSIGVRAPAHQSMGFITAEKQGLLREPHRRKVHLNFSNITLMIMLKIDYGEEEMKWLQ